MALPIIPSPPLPPWIDLPTDLTANILKRLDWFELLQSAQKVCTTWWSVWKDPAMWRVIHMSIPQDLDDKYNDQWSQGRYKMLHYLEEMCRDAVDRSQGQLIDINIEDFVSDKLLQYIAKRSSQLRRLRIAYGFDMSPKGLIAVVQNNPLLDELHLSDFSSSISSHDIETIGLSCPMLKSFTFENCVHEWSSPDEDNEYSLAISKTMRNLCHFRLVGNEMTNEGLQAILDGCLHLESLDLRKCSNLHLEWGLLKLCSERITDLRFPEDPINDFEFIADFPDYDAFDFRDFEHYDAFDDDDSEDHDPFEDPGYDNELPFELY